MRKILGLIIVMALVACGGASAPASSASTATTSAAKPDDARVVEHLKSHVTYPIGRDALLLVCADTPEFSAAERKWFSDRLPPGTYASPEDVLKALHQ